MWTYIFHFVALVSFGAPFPAVMSFISQHLSVERTAIHHDRDIMAKDNDEYSPPSNSPSSQYDGINVGVSMFYPPDDAVSTLEDPFQPSPTPDAFQSKFPNILGIP